MKSGYTRGQAFLLNKAPQLDAQTKLDIKNKKLRFVDQDMYLRFEATGKAGIFVALDETNVRKVGITNWNENKLPKGVNFIIEKIRVGYATHASITNSANVSYTTKLSSADKAIQNAELRIKQNGVTIISIPVARCMSEEISRLTQGQEDAFPLGSLQLIKENLPVSIELEFPAGSTVDTVNKHHLEVRLMGTATASR